MKILPKWYQDLAVCSFISLAFSSCAIALIFLNLPTLSGILKVGFIIMCLIMFLVFSVITLGTYKTSAKYYEEYYIPKSKFKIDKYDNVIILVLDNYEYRAWVFNYRINEIANLDHIYCVLFYDKNKKAKYHRVLPYDQLTEKGKKAYASYLASNDKGS